MRIVSTVWSVSLLLVLPPLSGQQQPDKKLFDFETGTYSGWTFEGDPAKPSFGATPFKASAEVPKWRNDRDFTGWQGDYIVAVGDTRHGSVIPGKLVSDEFAITHKYLRFRYGGELHPDVRIWLNIGGQEVRTAFGNNSYDMRLRGWDVAEFRGRKARIVIQVMTPVAALLRADDFHLSDTPPPVLGTFHPSEQESLVFRPGEFKLLLRSPDDHFFAGSSIVRGPDGQWHLYAARCARKDRYREEKQQQIVHATAPSVDGPWTLRGTALEANAEFGEDFLWDPFVLVHDGRFYMFYTGSGRAWTGWDPGAGDRWKVKDFGKATQGPHGIHLATSPDGITWQRHGNGPLFRDSIFARHPFVLRHENRWLMYYSGTEPPETMGKHAVLLRTSTDLIHWEERRVALADNTDVTPWPEHPFFRDNFIYRNAAGFWLFTGPVNNNNQSRFHYRRIYRSDDPYRFTLNVDYNGVFAEGSPRIITDERGRTWISHSGQYAGGVWLAPLSVRDKVEPGYARGSLDRKVLETKIRGGWAGQMIGVSYGAPTEFKSNGKIYEAPIVWRPELVAGALDQDDLYVEMTFAEVVDKYSADAPLERFGEAFRDSTYTLWHANASARRNLQRGVSPHLTGSPQYNMHANDIDFQIEADFIGLMYPGMPRRAALFADRVGRMINTGDGLYGGIFVAAMYSSAFLENDPRKVVEAGLAALPPGSGYAAIISDVLSWTRRESDWRKVWQMIQDKWDRDDVCPKGALDPYNIDARLNGAYIALALLHGQSDFARTLEIATRAGQDSDCNPSSAGGILGVMLGYDAIPETWRAGIPAIADRKFRFTNYSFDQIVQSSLHHSLRNIAAAGGFLFNNHEARIPLEAPARVKLEQFQPGVPAERILASDRRWKWTGNWKEQEDARISSGKGSTAELSFEGTGISLAGPHTKEGGVARVWIDGRPAGEFDTREPNRNSDIDVWHKLDLKPGRHNLRVEVQGSGAIHIMRAIVFRPDRSQ